MPDREMVAGLVDEALRLVSTGDGDGAVASLRVALTPRSFVPAWDD
ncbi:MAG: hypothetical protein LBV06_07015 [Propionibacteriaceae bacterium]|jgi:hypothetical protein|nr:hypothetical protein [Propionibacteriaceae bacterium]